MLSLRRNSNTGEGIVADWVNLEGGTRDEKIEQQRLGTDKIPGRGGGESVLVKNLWEKIKESPT